LVTGNGKVNHGGNDRVGWVISNMKGAIVIARVMVVIIAMVVVICLAMVEVVVISVGIERHGKTHHRDIVEAGTAVVEIN